MFDLNAQYVIDPAQFLSMGKSTPFAGIPVFGKCEYTFCGGKIAFGDPARMGG